MKSPARGAGSLVEGRRRMTSCRRCPKDWESSDGGIIHSSVIMTPGEPFRRRKSNSNAGSIPGYGRQADLNARRQIATPGGRFERREPDCNAGRLIQTPGGRFKRREADSNAGRQIQTPGDIVLYQGSARLSDFLEKFVPHIFQPGVYRKVRRDKQL